MIVPDVVLVLGAELIVDWIKHAFITKFNEISSDVSSLSSLVSAVLNAVYNFNWFLHLAY